VNSRNQSYIIYLLLFIAIVAMVYFNIRQQPDTKGPLTISEIAQMVQADQVDRIVVKDDNSLTVITSGESGQIEQAARKEPETTLVVPTDTVEPQPSPTPVALPGEPAFETAPCPFTLPPRPSSASAGRGVTWRFLGSPPAGTLADTPSLHRSAV